ncbi:predicted protein [Lichtheimia corymbifera JMRC:FSU:9682]|uniref:Uncharacterized protein n=1 Tax=Lichtheimia corymbifera JMRC:FSU:9682 TaxID=1263082 RepID=A0A068SF22_9FUNG|nr:predicted protein [Lichtheimia corymbifera JMRC:FSU:9682]
MLTVSTICFQRSSSIYQSNAVYFQTTLAFPILNASLGIDIVCIARCVPADRLGVHRILNGVVIKELGRHIAVSKDNPSTPTKEMHNLPEKSFHPILPVAASTGSHGLLMATKRIPLIVA